MNLLAVSDSREIGGDGAFFRIPFETIEGVVIVDDQTLAVVNDTPRAGVSPDVHICGT